MNPNIADQRGAQPHQLNHSHNLGSPNRQDLISMDDEPNRPRPVGVVGRNDVRSSDQTYLQSEAEPSILHVAMKLKDQNTNLKGQLRELKFALKDTLAKVQSKKREKESTVNRSIDAKSSGLARELDTVQRQIVQHKKEIHTLRSQLDAYHNEERVTKLENLLKDKNRTIEKLTDIKRNEEQTKLLQDKELDAFQKDFAYEKKLGELQEEARSIRQKIKNMTETNRLNDKTFIRQQEYLVCLNNQYRILCEKLGIAPSMNFTRADELNQIVTKRKQTGESSLMSKKRTVTQVERQKLPRKDNRSKSVKDPRESLQKIEPTEENVKKLQAKVDGIREKTTTSEKENIREVNRLENQKKELLAKFAELEVKYKEKEKEASILHHRAKELKRIARFHALRPIEAAISEENGQQRVHPMSATSMLSPGTNERPVSLLNGKKGLKPIQQSHANVKLKETPIPTTDGLPFITQPKNVLAPVSQGY